MKGSKKYKKLADRTPRTLVDNITDEIGVAPDKIHILDILYHAIELDEKSGMYFSSIAGTGQERRSEEGQNKHPAKKYFSGPISTSTHPSTRRSKVFSEAIMSMDGIILQTQQVFESFAIWAAKQTANEKIHSKSLKWLIAGHSRGGAMARYLSNLARKSITLNDGITVTIEAANPAYPDKRALTVTFPERSSSAPARTVTFDLEIDILGFSATSGPSLKGKKELTNIAPTHLLDFLATGDVVPGYGRGMKPFNQRRTINPGSTLFAHMPVNHPFVTKADSKRILHLEIELLTSYLYLQHLGYPVPDVDKLKIPVRDKPSWFAKIFLRKKVQSRIHTIQLSNGRGFSNENRSTADCISTIQVKMAQLHGHKKYQPSLKTFYTNVHGETDRRFLVMRSGVYKTALEERLALAKLEGKTDSSNPASLVKLFDEDRSPEVKAYVNFMQRCLMKSSLLHPTTGFDDPHLKNPANRSTFLLLKTAAILKNHYFAAKLFHHLDHAFGAQYSEKIKFEDKILSFLEKFPVEKHAETLKKEVANMVNNEIALSAIDSPLRKLAGCFPLNKPKTKQKSTKTQRPPSRLSTQPEKEMDSFLPPILAAFAEKIKLANTGQQIREIAEQNKIELLTNGRYTEGNRELLCQKIDSLAKEKMNSLESASVITNYIKAHPHLVAVIKYATFSAAGLVALKLILPAVVVAAIGKLGFTGVRVILSTHLGQAISAAAISGTSLVSGFFKPRKPFTSQELMIKVIESAPNLMSELQLPNDLPIQRQLQAKTSAVKKMELIYQEITNPRSKTTKRLISALNKQYGIKSTLPMWVNALQERLYPAPAQTTAMPTMD